MDDAILVSGYFSGESKKFRVARERNLWQFDGKFVTGLRFIVLPHRLVMQQFADFLRVHVRAKPPWRLRRRHIGSQSVNDIAILSVSPDIIIRQVIVTLHAFCGTPAIFYDEKG